ncbi:MAG: undecaprenyl-phosphate glucose phosphotransferase [Caldilinea sp.]|nr:undecaprenyl-phosphate glucose phosphotransferase [Caldilinea sp.]
MATVDNLNLAESASQESRTTDGARESWLASLARRVPERLWTPLLVGSDALLILAAFVTAYGLRYQLQLFIAVDPAFQLPLTSYLPQVLLLVVFLLIAFRFSQVYPYQPGRSWVEETWRIATAATAGVIILIAVNLLFRPMLYSRLVFLYTAILVTLYLGVSRLLIMMARSHLRDYDIGVRRVLLIGAGDVGRMVMRTLAARPDYGWKLVGFLDDNPAKSSTDVGRFKALGPIENASEVMAAYDIQRVIICLPWQTHRTIQRLLRECEQMQVDAYVVPDLFQLTKNQMKVQELNGIPLISTRDISIQGWNLVLKRAFDLVVGASMAVVSLPLLLVIAAAIRLDTPGPIIFKQTRVGKNGKEFSCFKFRSMVHNADDLRSQVAELNESTGPLFKIRNDPRLTRVGRFIRRYSLDELPQLLNVLRGEMSLIGPRPNLPEEVAQYQEWMKKRLSVSPGLTGLWQVSGRSNLTFDEMVLLDIYYVENWSMGLDASILLRSVPAVLRATGAY